MNEIRYPVFVRDQDQYMGMYQSLEELSGDLENVDVQDNEYVAWDINGLPLELCLDGDVIKAKVLSSVSQKEELKRAILVYASLGRKERDSGLATSDSNDIVALFIAAEELHRSKSLLGRIKRFLGLRTGKQVDRQDK